MTAQLELKRKIISEFSRAAQQIAPADQSKNAFARRLSFLVRVLQMTARTIAKNIESVASQMSKQAGIQHGAKSSSVETIVSCYGDFYTSLAYAGFFFPEIRIVNGVPFARFPAAEEETPIDCVHVDLLHHNQAGGRSPEILNAFGQVLAEVWSRNLQCGALPGKFIYDNSVGFDVTYKP